MTNGVLCLEGDWEDSLVRDRSLVPVLQLIQSQSNIRYIHRTASTRDEFRRVIQEWSKAKYAKYPVLYLGFHGSPGAIQIGKELVPICDLFEFADKGSRRVAHFGSCETLSAPRKTLDKFLRMSKFTAICGFRVKADWLHSCALEILLLEELSRRKISTPNMHLFSKNLKKRAGSLARELGFHIWTR